MGWSDLGTQFCLELAFGVLLGLCFVARAPVGAFFHRLMGTTAALPLLAAALLPPLYAGASLRDPAVVAAAAALLPYPYYSGPVQSRRRLAALAIALACTGYALARVLARTRLVDSPGELALATASAMATGAVAGTVGLAMVLGHWYLTVPSLDVAHLRRMNRVTVASMLACLALVLASCLVFRSELRTGRDLLGPWGLFHLGTRVAVGLAVPLVFAWMTSGSLRYRNTRSATGILYASTVLVLIGTAVSISLQDAYGVPL
jgi:hypothetical protein